MNITVEGGKSVRLKTKGKYCDRDIVVTAEGGGIDTSDANSAADNIESGYTAYVDGEKVTGAIPHRYGGISAEATPSNGNINGTPAIQMSYTPEEKTIISPNRGGVYLKARASEFGDAQPEDVAAGKTFTSAAGLKEVGTAVASTPKLQEKTVTPTTSPQSVTPDSGYDGLSKVTVGAMPTATQATPSISVSSAGLITASATQTAGYVSAGTKSATKQLTTQAAKTITPSTSKQTAVASGRYTTGYVYVAGDANLKAANIKAGVSIFGVNGTYEGGEAGGVELVPVTIQGLSSGGILQMRYSDGGDSYATAATTAIATSKTVDVLKNSIVIISKTGSATINLGGGAVQVASTTNLSAYFIADTATIYLASNSGGSGSIM